MTDDEPSNTESSNDGLADLLAGLIDDPRWSLIAVERRIREWLADRDTLARAADAEEIAGYVALTDRQGDLLRSTVAVLRGAPPALTMWSHHDIPELAAALKAERDALAQQIDAVRAVHGALSTEGPMIMRPARGVITLVASDNTTIDMTFDQAARVRDRLISALSPGTPESETKPTSDDFTPTTEFVRIGFSMYQLPAPPHPREREDE